MGLNLNNYVWLSITSAAGVFMILWYYAYRSKLAIHDGQTARSLHKGSTLTGAGILIFVPWCLMGLVLTPLFVPFYVVLALSILGFVDDRYDLSFKLRLLVQVMAALVTLYAVGLMTPWWLLVLLTFCLLWWVNLFNFMDGANGMAGLHGLVSLGFYGLVFALKFGQYTVFSYVALAGVLVLMVYLIFNLGLNKMFMGDSGSLPLAWIIAVLALYAIQTETLNYAQVAFIHSVFIVDATLTLLYRINKQERVTQAHASHLYQRLIKFKYSHLQVSSVYALLTLLCCGLVWLTSFATWVVQYTVFVVVYLVLILVFIKLMNLARIDNRS